MNFELTASMMCANYGNLEQEVKNLEAGGIDSFHIDIMDGHYVPNFAMSLNDLRYILHIENKPLDVHLMVEHPNNTIDLFINNLHPGDTIYIHPEAEYHPSTTLQKIIDAGLMPGIAINPGTSVEEVGMLETCDQLPAIKDKMHFDIYWDGACGIDKIREFAPRGVKGFVLGTTLLFGKNKPYGETLKAIREMKF